MPIVQENKKNIYNKNCRIIFTLEFNIEWMMFASVAWFIFLMNKKYLMNVTLC